MPDDTKSGPTLIEKGEKSAPKPIRVLLLDDRDENLVLRSAILRQNGYDVVTSRYPADRPWSALIILRYRDDLSRPELLTPGEIYEVTVPMAVTSNVFGTGHRIRLDISSSNFPHYDRNSNTGGAIARTSGETANEPVVWLLVSSIELVLRTVRARLTITPKTMISTATVLSISMMV